MTEPQEPRKKLSREHILALVAGCDRVREATRGDGRF
jgi:hypothetical protein